MRLSKHSRMRLRDRANIKHQNQRAFFKKALKEGKSPDDIKDARIRNFLNSKRGNHGIKLYQNYVFIYSHNSKRLFTMYKLPNKFLEKEEVENENN